LGQNQNQYPQNYSISYGHGGCKTKSLLYSVKKLFSLNFLQANYIDYFLFSHILYGAMVGGPGPDDSFRDQRSNEKQSSVTLDFNAG